ncbi:hypothetical protein G9A89_015504 [Geosiphon pyriformis]|nr:hypothetical protein G9A89_015504 [Geosiphon pyriformis]
MKKTLVRKIDNFPFIIDGITIPVKVLEKEMPFTETYMAFGSTSNWAKETEQKIFEETKE